MVKGRVDSTGSAAGDRVVPGDEDYSQSAAGDRVAAVGGRVTTVRVPLISVAITRPARRRGPQVSAEPRTAGGGRARADFGAAPTRALSFRGMPLPRLAFYVGAVALGALEVVEWPVTLLVVAGTYVTDRARNSAAPAAPRSVGHAAARDRRTSAGSHVAGG